jgi:hypothetical protein
MAGRQVNKGGSVPLSERQQELRKQLNFFALEQISRLGHQLSLIENLGDLLYLIGLDFAANEEFDQSDLEAVIATVIAESNIGFELGLKVGRVKQKFSLALTDFVQKTQNDSDDAKYRLALDFLKNFVLEVYQISSITPQHVRAFMEFCTLELYNLFRQSISPTFTAFHDLAQEEVQEALLEEWGIVLNEDSFGNDTIDP